MEQTHLVRRGGATGWYIASGLLAVGAVALAVVTWRMSVRMGPASALGGLVLMYPIFGTIVLTALAVGLFAFALQCHEDGRSRELVVATTRAALFSYAGALLATLATGLVTGAGRGLFAIGGFLFAPVYWTLSGEPWPIAGLAAGAIIGVAVSRTWVGAR